LDNNREEQVYARVGRVCRNDRGGPSPAQDRWTTFLKARLNCSIPADIPFYFNEIQSVSDPAPTPDGDAVVYAVFQTSRSAMLMSAVCAFRMSSIISNFEHGRFKTQRTPQSLWGPLQKFYANPADRPGRCVPDSRKIQDVSFILKNPLMYDLVDSLHKAPLLIEGPAKSELTKIAVLSQVRSVRGQPHDVVYVARSDGQILKVINLGLFKSGAPMA
jgi:semaphorin 6